MKRFSIVTLAALMMLATPAMADRFDVIKNLAVFEVIASVARDNCPEIDHDNIRKAIIGVLNIIKETDAEAHESAAIEADFRADAEDKLHEIGSTAWCRKARSFLKEYAK